MVAGSVGPTGDLFEPLGVLTEAMAVEVFEEQMRGLKEGGADVAWIETMSSLEEIKAAATAAANVGLPYTFTASFDTAGTDHDGHHARGAGRIRAVTEPAAARDRRQLRRRRIRPGRQHFSA